MGQPICNPAIFQALGAEVRFHCMEKLSVCSKSYSELFVCDILALYFVPKSDNWITARRWLKVLATS